MKKIYILLIALSLSNFSFSQKKKSITKTPANLAKSDNVSAEIVKDNLYLFITSKTTKDTIFIKKTDKIVPTACKITPFTANGTKLYLFTWTEKVNTKTDLKTEDKTIIYSNVYDVVAKKEVFYNTQLTNNIVEKVFLDRNKTASETQTRTRKEGFEFTLNPDGTITQKTAKQLNKWKYDPASNSFVDVKKK
jgi:hypothetical protein